MYLEDVIWGHDEDERPMARYALPRLKKQINDLLRPYITTDNICLDLKGEDAVVAYRNKGYLMKSRFGFNKG